MSRLEKMTFRAWMEADSQDVGSVSISGPITSWAWPDYNETDSLMVRRELEKVKDARRLNIYIDSPGGYLDEGMTMMRLIAEHGAQEKHAYCMECASAATLLCIPCSHVTAYEGAEFMIHMPRASVSGTPDEIISYGQGLAKRAGSVAGLYAKRIGKTVEEITEMMRAETWMTPEEAVACGFADDIAPIGPDTGRVMMQAARSEEEESALCAVLGYRPRAHRADMRAHKDNPQTSADCAQGSGAPLSGAICDKDKEENRHMTMEDLKKDAPELLESIMQAGREQGAKQERERLMALDGLMDEEMTGEIREIIDSAKYGDKPLTAPEAAMEILTAQRKTQKSGMSLAADRGKAYLNARRTETEGMKNVVSGAASDNDPGAGDEMEIDAFAAEMARQQSRF